MIVEDDLMARRSIEKLCEKIDGLNIKWICEDANSALDVLKVESPDLIFLDIGMPGMSGFDFLKNANQSNLKQFIVTSGKEQNALAC